MASEPRSDQSQRSKATLASASENPTNTARSGSTIGCHRPIGAEESEARQRRIGATTPAAPKSRRTSATNPHTEIPNSFLPAPVSPGGESLQTSHGRVGELLSASRRQTSEHLGDGRRLRRLLAIGRSFAERHKARQRFSFRRLRFRSLDPLQTLRTPFGRPLPVQLIFARRTPQPLVNANDWRPWWSLAVVFGWPVDAWNHGSFSFPERKSLTSSPCDGLTGHGSRTCRTSAANPTNARPHFSRPASPASSQS